MSAMRSTSVDLFTVYGTLVMKIVLPLREAGPSIHVARMRIDPAPVL